mgnify:CR=1 FL=1
MPLKTEFVGVFAHCFGLYNNIGKLGICTFANLFPFWGTIAKKEDFVFQKGTGKRRFIKN